MIKNRKPIISKKMIEVTTDPRLDGLINEYSFLLNEEVRISDRKKAIIAEIDKMTGLGKDEIIFTETHMIHLARKDKRKRLKGEPIQYRLMLTKRREARQRN